MNVKIFVLYMNKIKFHFADDINPAETLANGLSPSSHRKEQKQNMRRTVFVYRWEAGNVEGCSEELLGHVGPTTLVDDVGDDENYLERNNQEDKEAHTRSRGGDNYKSDISKLQTGDTFSKIIPFNKWPCRFSLRLRCDERRVSCSWLKRLL
jgi:hypothetical protein